MGLMAHALLVWPEPCGELFGLTGCASGSAEPRLRPRERLRPGISKTPHPYQPFLVGGSRRFRVLACGSRYEQWSYSRDAT